MGLFTSKRAIMEAELMIPQWERIANDCIKLVNETVRPEVFFDRYDLLLEMIRNMSTKERIVKFIGKKPSRLLAEYTAMREEMEGKFIDRAYYAAREKSFSLKTEKGKLNSMNKFFEKMAEYGSRMSKRNWSKLDGIHWRYMEEINGK
jgi:hypothetical protein